MSQHLAVRITVTGWSNKILKNCDQFWLVLLWGINIYYWGTWSYNRVRVELCSSLYWPRLLNKQNKQRPDKGHIYCFVCMWEQKAHPGECSGSLINSLQTHFHSFILCFCSDCVSKRDVQESDQLWTNHGLVEPVTHSESSRIIK